MLSVEVLVATRGDFRPDPKLDPLIAIFYSVLRDIPPEAGARRRCGVLWVDKESAEKQQSTCKNISIFLKCACINFVIFNG